MSHWAFWKKDVVITEPYKFGVLGIGQSLVVQSIQPSLSPMVLMNLALSNPQIHGDERDGIIAKLNQLQAYWGAGTGYYNQQGGAVNFSPENPYCRFKVCVCTWTRYLLFIWDLGLAVGLKPMTSCTGVQCSTNWDNSQKMQYWQHSFKTMSHSVTVESLHI